MSVYPRLEDLGIEGVKKSQDNTNTPAGDIISYAELSKCLGFTSPEYESDIPVPSYEAATRADAAHARVPPVPGAAGSHIKGEIKPGVRQVHIIKENKKVGVHLREVNKGIFISYVKSNSPASRSGLRFGDQVLSIDETLLTGFTGNKAMELIKTSKSDHIIMTVRDRPLEHTVLVHKDSSGRVGIELKNGVISAVIRDSPAASSGLLTNHKVIELNSKNVLGISHNGLQRLIQTLESPIRFTIMPKVTFDKLTRGLESFEEVDRSEQDA